MSNSRAFPSRSQSVSAARLFVREMLRDQPRETVDAVELMTSELATNAVKHAHSAFELTIHTQGQIRVEVHDASQGKPTLMHPEPAQASGRGLMIVEAMSDAWGVIPSPGGKTVWFALEHGGAHSAPRR
jgi:anti-sigma regulatory factor (Ser/Thr protein kinase)